MESNVRDKVVFASPKDFDERALLAGTCVRKLGIKFPAVIDGFENTAERAYTGWPYRIYLIDANGRIAYKSRPGPFGFKPEELKAALGRLSSEQRRDQRCLLSPETLEWSYNFAGRAIAPSDADET